jgi:predicted 2-oxoglutarate/Fe(II)-dependent dioxygenase YbiX
MKITASSQLQDFIQVYSNLMPHRLCDAILNEYSDECDWEDAQVGFGTVDKEVRNCKCVDLSSPNSIPRQQIEYAVSDVFTDIISTVQSDHSTLYISQDTGYDLLRYDVGDYYRQHVDHFEEHARSVSCSICLNDEYDGGEFAFFDSEVLYKLNKGDVLVFPSNHLFPHEIKPVTKGTRYSIVSWLV